MGGRHSGTEAAVGPSPGPGQDCREGGFVPGWARNACSCCCCPSHFPTKALTLQLHLCIEIRSATAIERNQSLGASNIAWTFGSFNILDLLHPCTKTVSVLNSLIAQNLLFELPPKSASNPGFSFTWKWSTVVYSPVVDHNQDCKTGLLCNAILQFRKQEGGKWSCTHPYSISALKQNKLKTRLSGDPMQNSHNVCTCTSFKWWQARCHLWQCTCSALSHCCWLSALSSSPYLCASLKSSSMSSWAAGHRVRKAFSKSILKWFISKWQIPSRQCIFIIWTRP